MADAFEVQSGCTEVKLPVKGGRRCSVYLRPNLTRTVDGKTFVNLNMKVNQIKTILCAVADDKAKAWEVLAKTNVVEQLHELKRLTFKESATNGLSVKRYRSDLKCISANVLAMPDTAVVKTADIGTVTGIDMTLLRKRGLWLELKPANFAYLANAIAAQFGAGGCGVKPAPRGKRRGRANAPDGYSPCSLDTEPNKDTPTHGADGSDESAESSLSDNCGVEPDVDHDTTDLDATDPPSAQHSVRAAAPTVSPLRQTNLLDMFSKAV